MFYNTVRMPVSSGRLATALTLFIITALPAVGADSQGEDFEIPILLSLDDSEKIFNRYSYDLLLNEAAIHSAEADAIAAGAFINPQFGVNENKPYSFDRFQCPSPCDGRSFSYGVSDQGAIFDIITGKRSLRSQVAEATLRSTRFTGQYARRTLLSLLRQQFVQTELAKEALNFAIETSKLTETTHNLVQIRYRTGAVSEADVSRSHTALLETLQSIDSASSSYNANKIGLLFLLGVRKSVLPAFDIEGTNLKQLKLRDDVPQTREELLALAIDHRDDLKAAMLQVARSDRALQLAKLQRFPDVAFTFSIQRPSTVHDFTLRQSVNNQINDQLSVLSLPVSIPGSAYTPPTYSIGVTMTLPLLYQQLGEIGHAQADLDAQTILEKKTEAQIVSDVGTAYDAYLAAKSKINRMENGLLAEAKRSLELVQIQYEKGAASLLELSDSRRTYISVNQEYFQNLNDYLSSIFQLEQAVGTDLR